MIIPQLAWIILLSITAICIPAFVMALSFDYKAYDYDALSYSKIKTMKNTAKMIRKIILKVYIFVFTTLIIYIFLHNINLGN